MVALTISVRLCGGMFVAMPTAIPDEPLISRFGTRAGSTSGSCVLSSKFGLEIDRLFVDVVQQRVRDARQPRFRVPVCRRRVAVHRSEISLPIDQHDSAWRTAAPCGPTHRKPRVSPCG